MTLFLPQTVARNLKGHANASFPRECCGVLLGQDGRSVLEVVDAAAAVNVAPLPDRFVISPRTLLELERKARDRELCILGFYHSHPRGDTFPSATDRDQAIPGTLHLILSVNGRGAMAQHAWMHLENRGLKPVRISMTAP
ncbi:MAG TPA: M67 family metallopeptidase [Candidatus Eisenbacteria bacterium]|nr:M67 family metallopeptidase [Candidatus Eisenbacteria bacterium]